jgi:hypothetical protein
LVLVAGVAPIQLVGPLGTNRHGHESRSARGPAGRLSGSGARRR